MKKTIAITGTTTIKQILDAFKKLNEDVDFKSFKLEISDMMQDETVCKVAAIPTPDEKKQALESLSPQDQIALASLQAKLAKLQAKVDSKAKELASERVKGETSIRFTIRANCQYLGCK
jgi:hypothetical protein